MTGVKETPDCGSGKRWRTEILNPVGRVRHPVDQPVARHGRVHGYSRLPWPDPGQAIAKRLRLEAMADPTDHLRGIVEGQGARNVSRRHRTASVAEHGFGFHPPRTPQRNQPNLYREDRRLGGAGKPRPRPGRPIEKLRQQRLLHMRLQGDVAGTQRFPESRLFGKQPMAHARPLRAPA
ncbi:hypothetical protein LAUMK136_04307 [Mycobacterium attenuatum]|uniref:Uncharacterized protein n=1 Tax=Mycobacterium attenuatum TaxID=2341086 RepID=A0A498QC19_9MYCO|nr:hypothetical protein LAUMK136_04307 [Mycobacterium attenuatum]